MDNDPALVAPIPAEILRCPVHGIPDCSPLLNGCRIPNRLAAAYLAGYADAVTCGKSPSPTGGQADA